MALCHLDTAVVAPPSHLLLLTAEVAQPLLQLRRLLLYRRHVFALSDYRMRISYARRLATRHALALDRLTARRLLSPPGARQRQLVLVVREGRACVSVA